MVNGWRIALWQIGDGAIVGLEDDKYWLAFPPETGRYANETHFITDSDSLDHLQILIEQDTRLAGLALLTDGLQRLCLRMDTLTPHAGFFAPLFAKLQATPTTGLRQFQAQLRGLLASPSVNQRTDDDKTLVLVCRREGQ